MEAEPTQESTWEPHTPISQWILDGPVSLAKDLMVWNITKDEIKVRNLINTKDTWPLPHSSGNSGTRGPIYPMSKWLSDSEVKFPGIDEYPDVLEF